MNAQKLLGLIVLVAIVAAAFVHGSMSMSEGVRLAMHGWWFISKMALALLAGCVLLVRRMRSASSRSAASEACLKDEGNAGR